MGRIIVIAILQLMVMSVSVGEGRATDNYFLYTPAQISPINGTHIPGDGVLAQRLRVNRGDTLGALALKYYGTWRYYPQILPFNKQIKNPDRIIAGDELMVPVSSFDAFPAPARVKRQKSRKPVARVVDSKQPVPAAKPLPPVSPLVPLQKEGVPEQVLYEKAIQLYRNGEYRLALAAFDRFLNRYPTATLAADATLYRAECYLQLSEQ